MCRAFPHHGYMSKCLQSLLESENRKTRHQERTSLTFCGSLVGCVLTRLIRTLELPRVPSRTDPEVDGRSMSRRECGSVQDFGSNSLVPHIFLSSCRVSRNSRPAGSEILTRTYAASECGVGEDGLETHAIKILDNPGQILVL